MCADCHTPRTPKGEFDTSRWLAGADLSFAPIRPMPWAGNAPRLAGMPGWTEAEIVRFLTTGINLKGAQPKPPMPPYRFSKADAEAVAAYLKSLPAR
jgi:mono/diheme cytochrome c family protein